MSHTKMDDVVIPDFSPRLREAIEKKGINMTELGELIGRDRRSISNYCNDLRYPSFEAFYLICLKLGVSADYLLGLEGKKWWE